jgi:hypothetical protein
MMTMITRYAHYRSVPIEDACAHEDGIPTRREYKLYSHNDKSFVVEIDARELLAPLNPAEQLALYALIKRAVKGCKPGEEEFELPPMVST